MKKIKTILDKGRQIAWAKMKGRPKTLEDRKKFSLAKLGKPRAGDPKNWKHTEITKKKIRKAKLGVPSWNKGIASPWTSARNKLLSGENSPVWKGGTMSWRNKIYNSFEYKQWRQSVFKKNNYTCQDCGLKSGNGLTVILNADHIKPFSLFPALRFELNNGRTLCVECHRKTETFGGRMNNPEIIKKYQIQ